MHARVCTCVCVCVCVPLEMCATHQRSTGMPSSGLPVDKLQKWVVIESHGTVCPLSLTTNAHTHTQNNCLPLLLHYTTMSCKIAGDLYHTHTYAHMLSEVGGLGLASLAMYTTQCM